MDERAVVIERPGLSWSGGAPIPIVVADEQHCFIAFFGPDLAEDEEVRVAELQGCVSVRFGFPNDEALHGHPLWGKGLQFYAAHEVLDSRWLAEVRENEAVHPYAEKPVPFPQARHFFLAFHDSCVEVLAEDIVVREQRFASPSAAAAALATEIATGY